MEIISVGHFHEVLGKSKVAERIIITLANCEVEI